MNIFKPQSKFEHSLPRFWLSLGAFIVTTFLAQVFSLLSADPLFAMAATGADILSIAALLLVLLHVAVFAIKFAEFVLSALFRP